MVVSAHPSAFWVGRPAGPSCPTNCNLTIMVFPRRANRQADFESDEDNHQMKPSNVIDKVLNLFSVDRLSQPVQIPVGGSPYPGISRVQGFGVQLSPFLLPKVQA